MSAEQITKFIIREDDPETFTFIIGDKEVSTVNHDEHGWTGIEAAKEMFREAAKILGCDVIEE